MDIIYLLLPISILLALIGLAAYIWSVKNGQFDDLETPAIRMLFDDQEKKTKKEEDDSSSS